MTEPTPATGEDAPDKVLHELLNAFANDPKPADAPPIDPSASTQEPTPRRDRRSARRARRATEKREKGDVKKARKQAKRHTNAARKRAERDGKVTRKRAKAGSVPPGGGAEVAAPAAGRGDVVIAKLPPPIVIGADDDLRDTVYLDEAIDRGRDEPARDGGRGTISIGDDLDSSGAFDAVDVPSRSMDPRVRARRIAVKRAEGRRRLVWVAAIGGVVLLVVGALAVFASSLFAVDEVVVQGAVYTEPDKLQAVIDDMTGEPILLVDTLRAERQLEQIPWVERAQVSTDFPHTVLIDIRERVPLASFVGSDGRYRVIDRDGRVLDVMDGQPADYLLITGPAPDTEPGGLAGAPFASAAQLVGALPAEIRAVTTNVSVDASTGDLGLMLQPAIEVNLGGTVGLDGKLARLLQLTRDGLLGIVRIDVSTNEVSVTRG